MSVLPMASAPALLITTILAVHIQLINRRKVTVRLQAGFFVVWNVRRGLGNAAESLLLVGISSSTLIFFS